MFFRNGLAMTLIFPPLAREADPCLDGPPGVEAGLYQIAIGFSESIDVRDWPRRAMIGGV